MEIIPLKLNYHDNYKIITITSAFHLTGKTTLMRSIANGSVEGFPDPSTVRTVFVEADILGELSHLSCLEYIMQDPR